MSIRSLPAALLLLCIAAPAQSLDGGHTWTGRRRLTGTLEQLRFALGSQDSSVREPMETFLLGSAAGSSIEARITYANLDDDSDREAILEFGGAGATIYLVFDRDAAGWWYVGRRVEDNHYGLAQFRVANWPDSLGKRSLITYGSNGRGSGISVRGITVFQLTQGSLRRVLTADADGQFAIWGDPRSRTRSLQSFIRIEPDRLLLAKRYWTGADMAPRLTDFRYASEVECKSLARDSAGVYRDPVQVPAGQCAQAWTPLQ